MGIVTLVGGVAVLILFGILMYIMFGNSLRRRARSRAEQRQRLGERYDRSEDEYNNPLIPDFIEQRPALGIVVIVIFLFLIGTGINCVHAVSPGHRGVVLTMGKVKHVNLGEGIQFKLPYVQRIVDMKVTLEKEEVTESTASSDLQEIMTTLTVHFNIMPDQAWVMYQNMQQNYHQLLLAPVIKEDLKATTAKFTAEELIQSRALLVTKLVEKLRGSLEPYGIYVQTVNFVNFEFTPVFMDAIEAKVTAEQEALMAKNILVKIQYEAQQKIIQAEAQKNATILNAEAAAQQKMIAADAEAYKLMKEANATAEAIRLITDRMTPQYAQYLHLIRWDGKYPTTMLGTIEDLGILVNIGSEGE